jgi:hypothetical protein
VTGLNPFNHAIPGSDSGRHTYPEYAVGLHTDPLRSQSLNGCEQRKANRRPSQSDQDYSPWLARRYTNLSTTDVQLHNGLRDKIASGRRIPYRGTEYLYGIQPIIPGQTRDNAAGFHRHGPSPYTISDIWMKGPGSQPEHPGGPGKIAATTFVNPMSG